MLERGISGLFVVDASGTLAGIVTEGDLLRRDELGTERRRSWWLRLIASPGRQAADFTRTHGRSVADVMTHDVLSVRADAPLEEIVTLMEERRIKRVPVLGGRPGGRRGQPCRPVARVGRGRARACRGNPR